MWIRLSFDDKKWFMNNVSMLMRYGYFIQFHPEEWNIFQLELVCYYLCEDVCLVATMKIISKGKWNGG